VDPQALVVAVGIAAGVVTVLGGAIEGAMWLWQLPGSRTDQRATVAEVYEDLDVEPRVREVRGLTDPAGRRARRRPARLGI